MIREFTFCLLIGAVLLVCRSPQRILFTGPLLQRTRRVHTIKALRCPQQRVRRAHLSLHIAVQQLAKQLPVLDAGEQVQRRLDDRPREANRAGALLLGCSVFGVLVKNLQARQPCSLYG
jgi:hypothetical protein